MNTKFINIGCKTFEVAKQVFFLNSQYSKKDSRFCSLIFESFQPTIEFFCFGYMHNQSVSNWIQRYLNSCFQEYEDSKFCVKHLWKTQCYSREEQDQ